MEPFTMMALGGGAASIGGGIAKAFGGDSQAKAARKGVRVRDLLEEHGRPGHTVVLGETALLGLCGALDVPRWLYDEAMSGALGFWGGRGLMGALQA